MLLSCGKVLQVFVVFLQLEKKGYFTENLKVIIRNKYFIFQHFLLLAA